jgi:sporulation protein YqfC
MRNWASKWLDLPLDVTNEVPRIEMIGSSRLQIENHLGVDQFSKNKMSIKIKQGVIGISGKELKIKAIYPGVISIEGEIQEIKYIK